MLFLECYQDGGKNFLKPIVTGDEICIQYETPETKQSQKLMHTHSPNELKKIKQTFNNQKVMANVFCDEKGVLLVEFMTPENTINFAVNSPCIWASQF